RSPATRRGNGSTDWRVRTIRWQCPWLVIKSRRPLGSRSPGRAILEFLVPLLQNPLRGPIRATGPGAWHSIPARVAPPSPVRRPRNEALLAREHVQQRGLADVRAADKGELRQRLVRTRIQIRRAAIKN